ncbi:hypothetical protein B0H13DRAFT_1904221 [Mycena leptocephala]|nr:hypothetical protein B0H13DRAFT_1904221 [Mycena leptocephala]
MYSISTPETLASEAFEHFKEFHDPDLEFLTGNTKWHSHGLCSLAWVQWYLGDYSAAQMHAIEAQRLAIISADLYREAEALRIEATCCHTMGNYTKAMSLCIRARDILGLCGMSQGALAHDIMSIQAEIHKLKSEYVEARSIHSSIFDKTSIQDPDNYSYALLNVAEIDVMIGAPKDDVQRNCDRARKMLDIWGDVEGVIFCDVILTDLYLREGNSLAAKTILEKSLKMNLEYSQIRAECMLQLGDISKGHGDLLKAVEFWEAARSLFEHSSQAKQVQCIDERVANIGEDVLNQRKNNLARLADLNAVAGTVEELEDDLSNIEDLAKIDMIDVKEPGSITA